MRIPLLYRGEYSRCIERFMNYLEEQTDGEAMINSIKNDKSMWSAQEKRVQKIDRLARSLLIQGLLNDIYSLIDSNKTAKDLWDALVRHMLGSEYGKQDRKAAVLYEYETFKATEGELLLDTYIRYLQVINDLKKCGYSKDNASSSSADEKIFEVSYYLSESKSESEYETSEYYDNSTNYGLFVNYDDDQEIFHDAINSASENFIENHIDSQKDYDKSDVDHNDYEEKDQLVDNNETAKDLWDALERQMRGSEYGEQDRKAAILYEYETFKATEGEQLLDTYLRYLQVINDLKKCGYKKDNCEMNYKFLNNLQPEWKQYGTLMRQTKNLMDINIDALYNILKQSQGDMNDALGYKKKAIVITSDPLALVTEKTKVSKRKKKVVVSSDSEGSGADDFSELKKITSLLAKAFNRRKFYSKPTNNNLRTSSTSQSANKKQEFVKSDDKKVEQKADEKKRDMTKKDSDEQVLLAKDQAWMESSSDSDQKINANMVFMAQIEKVLSDSDESSSSAKETIAEVAYYTSEPESESEFESSEYYDNSTFIENHIDSQKDYDKSEVDHNDSEEKEHLVDKLIRKFNHKIAKCQKRIEKANQQSKDLENQNKDLQEKYDVLINQVNAFEEQNNEFNEQIKVLNKKNVDLLAQTEVLQINSRKKIDKQEILFNKMSRFENPSYFEKPKDLRPSLYDEKVIDLGYTLMFRIHSDEALEIEKFKRVRENKIEFAYDYGNLNASYVNEKINFLDDYFQEIINPDFEKIDSSFQQTSSLKPYVPNVILEKIIIDLEDEVVSLLEKEKANLKTIESLKSKGFESSEHAISESENQSENDCHVVEKECHKVVNSKVIAPGMFKLSVSQSVSPISMLCDSFDEDNLFIFNDESVRISPVSKMPFKKKPCDSMNVRSKSNSNKSLPRTVHRWLPKMQPLAEPVAKWIPRIVQICLWIIDSGCSKHMTGNRALLTNFVEKFLGTVRFGNNDFAVIAGYEDVVIGSMTIKKVYYVEGLGHNLFSFGQFCDKGLEVAFRKSTCFVRNEDGVDLLTGDRSLNLYTIALNEVASNSSTCLVAKASSSCSRCVLTTVLEDSQQVETPKNPFIASASIKDIEPFMQKVGYQGVVDKVMTMAVFPSYEAKHRLGIHLNVEKRHGFLRGVGRKELGE
nr:integrase, catalytic region, zinc finger, CCHC-type, peptidase aspartic, catalytic [Tanacetum cinerariifolium]